MGDKNSSAMESEPETLDLYWETKAEKITHCRYDKRTKVQTYANVCSVFSLRSGQYTVLDVTTNRR